MPHAPAPPHRRTVNSSPARSRAAYVSATRARGRLALASALLALLVGCGSGEDIADAGDLPARDAGASGDAGLATDASNGDAALVDAGSPVDRDMDGLDDAEDPDPAHANARLFGDSFDDDAMGWLFASVSMSIDAQKSVLQVNVLEPFVREGWIGPQNRWVDYYARTRLRVRAVGGSRDPSSGRAGLIVRVNQLSPDRYLQCALDLKHHLLALTEHEGGTPEGNLVASAALDTAPGEWTLLSIEVRGTGLRCRAGNVEVLGTSVLYGGGSVGFRSFDATFEADYLEVFDL